MNHYKVLGLETLQPIRTIEQVIKDTAVACRLVSDGASNDECNIYKSVVLRCLMHSLVSNAPFIKNQEIILYSAENKTSIPNQFEMIFSRNMWYDYQQEYLKCPEDCVPMDSIYSYDFDIKVLTSVVVRYNTISRAKGVQISESDLIDGGFMNSGRNAYYYFQIDVGMQKLIIPSSSPIFPIKIRGLFTFIDKECILDENSKSKLSFTINQSTDTLYLQSLSDEEFVSIIMISVPTILSQLGKEDSITPLMYDRAKISTGNLKTASKVPVYPFL